MDRNPHKMSFFQKNKQQKKTKNPKFNNVKNVEAKHEFLEDIHVIDDFMVGNEMQNVKYYLLASTVEDMRLFVAVEKGSGK